MVIPFTLLIALTDPLGLTRPLTLWPTILPLLITTAEREPPEHVVPTLTTTHAPSKLAPTPPPLLGRGDDRCVSSAGLRAGRSGVASRVPDKDFSSFPMLPPVLPDCASAMPGLMTTTTPAQNKTVIIQSRTAFFIRISLSTTGYWDCYFAGRTRRRTPHRQFRSSIFRKCMSSPSVASPVGVMRFSPGRY
jgi:hypothetical protein